MPSDYWTDHREGRKRARAAWWTCDCSRKVAPGEFCIDCGRNEDGRTRDEIAARIAIERLK